MKKYVNGQYIELTQQENEELQNQTPEINPEELSLEQRVENLEKQINSINTMLAQALNALNN